jgi:hypothetical protein
MTTEESSCGRMDGLREEAGRLLNNFLMYQTKDFFENISM